MRPIREGEYFHWFVEIWFDYFLLKDIKTTKVFKGIFFSLFVIFYIKILRRLTVKYGQSPQQLNLGRKPHLFKSQSQYFLSFGFWFQFSDFCRDKKLKNIFIHLFIHSFIVMVGFALVKSSFFHIVLCTYYIVLYLA